MKSVHRIEILDQSPRRELDALGGGLGAGLLECAVELGDGLRRTGNAVRVEGLAERARERVPTRADGVAGRAHRDTVRRSVSRRAGSSRTAR